MTDDSMSGPGAGLGVTARSQQFLRETRPWVALMSILTFVVAGLMVLAALAMLALGAAVRSAAGGGGAFAGGLVGVVYLVMAVVYIMPALYLWRYRTAIDRVVAGGSTGALEDALMHQRSVWRVVGILTIIMIAFAVIGIIAAIGIALSAGTLMR